MVQFFGAPRMARPRVGAGNLLSGTPLTGWRAAVLANARPWAVGTNTALPSRLAKPHLMATRCRTGDGGACGGG